MDADDRGAATRHQAHLNLRALVILAGAIALLAFYCGAFQ